MGGWGGGSKTRGLLHHGFDWHSPGTLPGWHAPSHHLPTPAVECLHDRNPPITPHRPPTCSSASSTTWREGVSGCTLAAVRTTTGVVPVGAADAGGACSVGVGPSGVLAPSAGEGARMEGRVRTTSSKQVGPLCGRWHRVPKRQLYCDRATARPQRPRQPPPAHSPTAWEGGAHHLLQGHLALRNLEVQACTGGEATGKGQEGGERLGCAWGGGQGFFEVHMWWAHVLLTKVAGQLLMGTSRHRESRPGHPHAPCAGLGAAAGSPAGRTAASMDTGSASGESASCFRGEPKPRNTRLSAWGAGPAAVGLAAAAGLEAVGLAAVPPSACKARSGWGVPSAGHQQRVGVACKPPGRRTQLTSTAACSACATRPPSAGAPPSGVAAGVAAGSVAASGL